MACYMELLRKAVWSFMFYNTIFTEIAGPGFFFWKSGTFYHQSFWKFYEKSQNRLAVVVYIKEILREITFFVVLPVTWDH